MVHWFFRISLTVVAMVTLLIVIGWMVLAAPFLSAYRQGIVAGILTEQLGYPVEILDDVNVAPGRISKVFAADVQIMSENIDDTVLAELALLQLELDVIALLDGRIDLDNITVDGLRVNALTLEDGRTSWTEADERSGAKIEADKLPTENDTPAQVNEGDILDFLRHRTASFTSIGLKIENQVTGFDFDFDLKQFNLEQLDGGNRLGMQGFGTVNAQEFQLDGSYPTAAPFITRASFGDLELEFNGVPIPQEDGGGYSGTLVLDTGAFADFLDVLKLESVLEGSGRLQADLISQPGLLRVSNLSTVVDLDQGQNFQADGGIENLVGLQGVDVHFSARLHPEGQPPANAKKIENLKLTGVSGQIISVEKALKLDEFLLATNAFKQGLDEVGPISIEHLQRTPEGHLAMQNIKLQAGPLDAPYIVAQGNILNLLELKQLDISGTLAVPATLVLDDLAEDVAEAFGSVEANFAIDDAQGFLSLNNLEAYTVNTDVWSLKAQMGLGDVANLGGVALDFDLDIADGAYFLKTLQLKEIDTGPLELNVSIRGDGTDISTQIGLAVESSRIDTFIDFALEESRPVIAGRVFSEKLNVDDLRDAVAGVVELAKIDDGDTVDNPTSEELDLQPLVLPKTTEAPPERYVDGLELQPLVLPKREPQLADLFDLETLLLETDLKIDIDINEITGQQGVSDISSTLIADEGKAKLGPLEVTYGKGYAKVGASMDLVKSPQLVSISGATSGWDFGNILDEVGLGIKAHGILSGNFNVTGNRASASAFLNSMYGSASINMSGGNIASSLLELAGLGIFPWLFSIERKTGYTEIVCVAAPLKVNAGRISSDSVVLETKSVQMVARGHADWRKDTIAIRAEGRRVGKPLGRSAWPFDVTGKLTDPNFNVQVGGSRSVRADGASKMPANRKPCKPDILQLE